MSPTEDISQFEIHNQRQLHSSRFVVHPKNWTERLDSFVHNPYKGVTFILNEGETVVVPSGWWMTWSYIEPTIALHEAVMNTANSKSVMNELGMRHLDSGEKECQQILANQFTQLEEWKDQKENEDDSEVDSEGDSEVGSENNSKKDSEEDNKEDSEDETYGKEVEDENNELRKLLEEAQKKLELMENKAEVLELKLQDKS